MQKIFVYGTLRTPRFDGDRAAYNHRLIAEHVKSRQPAVTRGSLYNLGSFPMACAPMGDADNALIVGELLEVEEAAMPLMDRLEGHPDMYHRSETVAAVNPDTPDEELHTVWIYWAGERLQKRLAPPITSGDWFNR